jgi:hypothetical protein
VEAWSGSGFRTPSLVVENTTPARQTFASSSTVSRRHSSLIRQLDGLLRDLDLVLERNRGREV